MGTAHFAEVYPSPDGWRFRVKANNNEIMCVGEAYVRRIDAESALKQLFGFGQPLDVAVRDHGGAVVNHYTIGAPAKPITESDLSQYDLDTVYEGPLEDTNFKEEEA